MTTPAQCATVIDVVAMSVEDGRFKGLNAADIIGEEPL